MTSSPYTVEGEIEREVALVRWLKRKGGWYARLAYLYVFAVVACTVGGLVFALSAVFNW